MSKKLRALQNRCGALVKAMRELDEEADGGILSDAQQRQFDEHKAEIEEINVKISREKELIEFERSLIPSEGNPGNAEPAIDPNQQQADEQKWESMGEFLRAVWRAGTGHLVDPRLVRSAVSGLNESVASEGGFLVQTDFAATLMAKTFDSTILMNPAGNYAGVSRIAVGANSNGVKIPAVNQTSRATGSRWGGVQVYWKEEGGTPTASKPEFRMIELVLKKLMGLVYASDESLSDATALESVVMAAFPDEMSFALQDAIINGTGAGQPLGILNSPCLVTITTGSQAATTLTAGNLENLYARMWARGIPNSVWLINQDVWPQLFAAEDTNGNALFLRGGTLDGAPFGSILGRPVVPIEQCASLGTKGDVIFADLSEYLWCDKGGLRADRSMHVKFLSDEETFRFIYRGDGKPAWNSALTPYKGNNTQSPFVCVETRDG